MNTGNKVPAIRFKAFNNEWNKQELGVLVNLDNGFAFKSKYFQIEPTNVIVLTPGSVSVGGGFQSGKGQFYDVNQIIPDKYVFKPRDLFITMTDLTPTAQALGFPAIIPDDGNTYLHNQRLGKLVGFKGDLDFLFYLFCTPKKQKEIVLTSSGTTVKHTSPSKFLNRYSYLPEKNEQTKIGNYFQQIDTLIALHQQKHDKLLNLKKSLLEKIFLKQGRKEPEIRFKGFSEGWVESEFSAIVSRQTAMSKAADLPRVEYEDIISGKGGLNKDILQKKSSKPGIKFDKADILYGKLRPYLKNWLLPEFEGIAVGDFWVLRANETDNNFVYYLIQTSAFQAAANISSGSKMPRSDWNLVSRTVFNIPENIIEKTKIGNFFKQLDTLLNQHQAQLKKLNNIKQACLEKMFV